MEEINRVKLNLKRKWDELNDNLIKNKEKLRANLMSRSIPSLKEKVKHIKENIEDEKFTTYDDNTKMNYSSVIGRA